jgi:hypothetical protein
MVIDISANSMKVYINRAYKGTYTAWSSTADLKQYADSIGRASGWGYADVWFDDLVLRSRTPSTAILGSSVMPSVTVFRVEMNHQWICARDIHWL